MAVYRSGRWGTDVQGTHCREGEVGCNVLLKGNIGDTLRSPEGSLMKKQNKELEQTVMDDGVGISDDLDWKNSSTLGLKLVRTLVENQLDGSIDLDNTNGTKFIIKFNIDNT